MNEEESILINRIAAKIKDLRMKKGVSQRLMYYDTELNLGRIETGKHDINITTLKKICQYFEVSLIEFFQDLE